MTAWVLFSWHEPRHEWIEVCAGSQERQKTLAADRQRQADIVGVENCRFVALPAGQRPDMPMAPGTSPLAAPAPAHAPDCWRSLAHHACAVALIERQSRAYNELVVRAATLEHAVRQPA